jgi:CheY-like chemotaxis protein
LILIVDDEARDRELLRLYLEDAGYVIIEAADGEEGRRLVSDRKPDLVLLDLQLPKLDGLALLQHFSEESVQTPVVVVSGAADLGGARTLGADVCLSKPVPRHTLLEAVRGLVPGPGEDARGRVLVIDDDPRSLSVVSGFLAGTGLVVETAIAGAEGLARIVADPPDVVILDLMMPEMSGFEVLAQLRDDPNTRGIPVVVLTSLTPTASQMRQLQAGAAEVFRKADTRGPDLLGQIRLLLARGRGSQ